MKEKLKELKNKNLFRDFRTITGSCSNTSTYNGKEYIMLASNNYFGLNTNHKVIAAAKKSIDKYGTGNEASRLIVNLDLHAKLEKEIASYRKCSAAMVFSSGYAANTGIISSIAGKGDIILSDQLNHASIIDGCRLSKATTHIYQHCNVEHLKTILKKVKKNNKKILIVTDTVFSMDGDIAPLNQIIELKDKYNFMLMVDDAHAIGVLDTNFKEIDIHMGTLSKALASQGGYVAGSKELIEFLRNFSRPFIYSTGLAPPNAAAALAALKILRNGKKLRRKLLDNSNYMRSNLNKLGFDALGELQIIPLIIGENKKTMQFQKSLEIERIFVTGIRPPTVQNARLRISIMATHTRQQLDKSLKAFNKIGTKMGLVPHAQR
ncbi:aminotransferase class I/II-fold pyridoxal phosphate-dependent enzyme [Candidatus Woesearchaeota archaeon]|nr:aminotransferase class I/II-fold pyridoxal phosphate-dependent enzyme [Candidatus Woesearchaeota archaeon]